MTSEALAHNQPLELLPKAVEVVLPPDDPELQLQRGRGVNLNPDSAVVTPESIGLSSVSSHNERHNVMAIVPSADKTTGFAVIRVVPPTGESKIGFMPLAADDQGKLRLTEGGVAIRPGYEVLLHEGSAKAPNIRVSVHPRGDVVRIGNIDQGADLTVIAQLPEAKGIAAVPIAAPLATVVEKVIEPPKEQILQGHASLREALIKGDQEAVAAVRALLNKERADAAASAWNELIAPKLEAWKADEGLQSALGVIEAQRQLFDFDLPNLQNSLEGLSNAFSGNDAEYFRQAVQQAGDTVDPVRSGLNLLANEEDRQALVVAVRKVGEVLGLDELAKDPRIVAATQDVRVQDLINMAEWHRKGNGEQDDARLDQIAASLRARGGDLGEIAQQLTEETPKNYAQQSSLKQLKTGANATSEYNTNNMRDALEMALSPNSYALPSTIAGLSERSFGFDPNVISRLYEPVVTLVSVGNTVREARSLVELVNQS